jgi:hypothetical protein
MAIYITSVTFHGINSGVISLDAFKFSTIPWDYGICTLASSSSLWNTMLLCWWEGANLKSLMLGWNTIISQSKFKFG